jgi:hypothetical protein
MIRASKHLSLRSAFKPKLLPKTSVTSGGMLQSYEARLKKQPLCDENILIPVLKRYLRKPVIFGLIGAAAFALHAAEPPPMPQRQIAQEKEPPKGRKILLADGDARFTLFVPDSWKASEQNLTVHFHTAEWFVIQEHLRRGATHPLATFYLGEGSTVYRRPFEEPKRFGRMLDLIEHELSIVPHQIEISSFSAGYGAVREIIKQPNYFDRIRTVILADSMYAGLETNALPRRPLREQIEVWVPLARAAMECKKTFVVTYSAVPTANYASSSECAQALLAALGLRNTAVLPNSTPAASDKDFPLLLRADAGNLHIWGYGGTNAQAHMTHPRHIADIWKALQN